MTTVYIPVYKVALSYTVTFGRRWTALEHLLLVRLSTDRLTVASLAEEADLPERLIVEALINLLRAGWVEVRTTDKGALFGATLAGKRRAVQEDLPVDLQKRPRWISMCVDRLTGAWLRADDLQLVHERDLPEGVHPLEPRVSTYDPDDGSLRELVYLERDESFERFEPNFRSPSRLVARVQVSLDDVEGLPPYSPLQLRAAVIEAASGAEPATRVETRRSDLPSYLGAPLDDIGPSDLIVGGSDHLAAVRECLSAAKSHIIIHSCFLHPRTIERLLPDFEAAAARRVRVDLLWGLRTDPEETEPQRPVTESEAVLSRLPPAARARVQLSPISSGSHAKVIVFDNRLTGHWETVVGSCNYLSSYYDTINVSVRCRSLRLAGQVLARLIATQQPASGAWSPVARRLERTWNAVKRASAIKPDSGTHSLTLLADEDHYACVTLARDQARQSIVIGCDLFGIAAETSVLVPMASAACAGRIVRLLYRRPSKRLREEGCLPDPKVEAGRGIRLEQASDLHGKFLLWDETSIAITSFNWMATIAENTRAKSAELGVLLNGPGIRAIVTDKLISASNGKISIRESANIT